MSLHIKSINADAFFILTFTPTVDSKTSSPGLSPGALTILLDPWLEGPTHVYHPRFSTTTRIGTSSIASLAELEHEPNLIVCSQDKSDHCNKATLTKLSPSCSSTFVSTPAAVKKIRSWNHFNPSACKALASYDPNNPDTIFRLPIPAPTPRGSAGELTISILAPPIDLSGIHNAIGITYRAPTDGISQTLPPTPPISPISATATPTTTSTTPRTLSALYAPHGLPHPIVTTWSQTHLAPSAALPLTALLHNFDEVDNPWYLGGTIAHGLREGCRIAKELRPRVWVGAHDEDKALSGVAVRLMRVRKVGVREVRGRLSSEGVDVEGEEGEGSEKGSEREGRGKMKVVVLGVGEEIEIKG